jgi:hypothetical protein
MAEETPPDPELPSTAEEQSGTSALIRVVDVHAGARDTDIIPIVAVPRSASRADAATQRDNFWMKLLGGPWPLLCILAVQATLSLQLVWSNTAFGDEGLYLWAGHLEIAHWLHGTPIPAFPTYFSGAPVIYPPIGAVADSLGGLAAARILSLAFMLAASAFLWATASALLSRRAAFFASALWATLASTQFLGAFATYDAMSLLLMTIAAWCVVRAGTREKAAGWLTAAAAALALANAAKYASGIFDPVVLALAVIASQPTMSWRRAVARGGTLLAYLAAVIVFLVTLGGGEYVTGIVQTTLGRASGTSTAVQVYREAWQLTAIVIVVALAGVLIGLIAERGWQPRLLLIVLAGAACLVPVEQARVHTTFSLQKHVDFGAWFAAIAAGYAIDVIVSHLQRKPLRWLTAAAFGVALIYPAHVGVAQARIRFHDWPNSESLVGALREVLPGTSGPIMVSTPDVAEYYLPEGTQWYRWSNLYTIRQLNGRALSSRVIGQGLSAAPYAARIRRGFFSIVVTNLSGSNAPFARQLVPLLVHSTHYQLAATIPYWDSLIWVRDPQVHVSYDLPRATGSPLVSILTPAARLRPLLGKITGAVAASGIAVFVLTLLIRFAWRRRKAAQDL